MKTIKQILLTATICLFIFSCSKDDGDSNSVEVNKDNLTGIWKVTKLIDYYDGESDELDIPNDCNFIIATINSTNFEFEQDEDCDGSIDDAYSTTYTLDGNILNLTNSDNEIEIFEVLSLTSTILKLKYEVYAEDEYSVLEFKRI